jgi:formylglycine-generating enzyme required for sulfatase activity
MDSTEVTNAEYAAFLAAGHPTSGQAAWCAWNTTYTPSGAWPSAGRDAYPVEYVDWCDAFAYCEWAGKHLCGRIGGGANGYTDFRDATRSEWFNACTAGGTRTYPYGSTYGGTTCNGSDNAASGTLPAGSMSTCEGGFPGLYDLSGNVWEWEDSCREADGAADSCRFRGGSREVSGTVIACAFGVAGARNFSSLGLGLRCCAASL